MCIQELNGLSRSLGLTGERQRTLPVRYREIAPTHQAQPPTYLKLSRRYLGLLLNFNVKRLKDGGVHPLVQGDPSG